MCTHLPTCEYYRVVTPLPRPFFCSMHFFLTRQLLLSGYIGWQEQCSHSGKPVSFSTMLPPIQLVYNHMLGQQWDRRNVEFHQVHHERMRCNYSITQWFDHLVGTTRWS